MTGARLDHCAIGVSDWEVANRFWREVVGAELVELPRGLWAYRFGEQLLTVHGPGATPNPPGMVPAGSSHVALTWPGTVEQAAEHLRAHDVEIEHGPTEVQAALGTARSVYFRDPDGTLVEFVSYSR